MDIKKADTQARFEKMLRASAVWQDKYAEITADLFLVFSNQYDQIGHYGRKHIRNFDQNDFNEFIQTRGNVFEEYYQRSQHQKPVSQSVPKIIEEADGQLWTGISKKQYNQMFKLYEQGFAAAFPVLGIQNYAQKKRLFDALVWEYVLQVDDYPFDLSVEDWQQYARHELSGESSIQYQENPEIHKNTVRLPLDDIRKHYELSDVDYGAILEDMALQHRMQKEDEWTDYQEYFRRSVKKLHIKLIPID